MSFKAVIGRGAYNQNNVPSFEPPDLAYPKERVGFILLLPKKVLSKFLLSRRALWGWGKGKEGEEEGKAIPSPREGGDWKWAPERQGCHFGRFYDNKKS